MENKHLENDEILIDNDATEEIAEAAIEEVAEETTEEVVEAVAEESAEEATEEVAEVATVEVPEDASHEIVEDTCESTNDASTEEVEEYIEEPIHNDPVIEHRYVPVAAEEDISAKDPLYDPSEDEEEETLSVRPIEEYDEDIFVDAPPEQKKTKKAKKEKKEKSKKKKIDRLREDEFDLEDDSSDEEEEAAEGLLAFFGTVKWKRTWSKITLALLLLAFAVPVGLLVYIILQFFL